MFYCNLTFEFQNYRIHYFLQDLHYELPHLICITSSKDSVCLVACHAFPSHSRQNQAYSFPRPLKLECGNATSLVMCSLVQQIAWLLPNLVWCYVKILNFLLHMYVTLSQGWPLCCASEMVLAFMVLHKVLFLYYRKNHLFHFELNTFCSRENIFEQAAIKLETQLFCITFHD